MIDIVINLDPIFLISLIIIGFAIGIIASMVGIGGGLLLVPFLIIFYFLSAQQASAISLLVMIFTSSSGSYTYYQQKRIDLRSGMFFAICVVPMSFLGSYIASVVEEQVLIVIFGVLLLVVSSRKISNLVFSKINKEINNEMVVQSENVLENQKNFFSFLIPDSIEKRSLVDRDGKSFNYTIKLRKTLLGALLGGFLSGMLGVGGGIIFVPVLMTGGVPTHVAIATSTFIIIFSALFGTLARLLYGQVLFDYALPLAIGSVIGAKIGATKVKRISSQKILLLFYVIVFLSGLRMILKTYGLFP